MQTNWQRLRLAAWGARGTARAAAKAPAAPPVVVSANGVDPVTLAVEITRRQGSGRQGTQTRRTAHTYAAGGRGNPFGPRRPSRMEQGRRQARRARPVRRT
jgi:hypothetical protein